MRIFLGRLSHESNTFASGVTPLEKFTHRHGAEILKISGDGSILGAVIAGAGKNGWTVVPSFDLSAAPGPTVADEVVARTLAHIEEDLPKALEAGLDGIFLALHGAMVSQSHDDVEGLVLTTIRRILGDRRIPVAAVLDLHANVSPEMADGANILIAYRCNPHTDAVESGLRTASLLAMAVSEGKSYRTHLVTAPVILPPTGTSTSEEPMAGLLKSARCLERGEIAAISICPGFALADTPFTCVSFQIVAAESAAASAQVEAASEELIHTLLSSASKGYPREWALKDAVTDALKRGDYPALIVEPADNIGGGAPGDATWVLQEFLLQNVKNAGVILAAPRAVQSLKDLPVGAGATISLGGMNPSLSGPELTLPVTVMRHSDGEFEVEDPHSHIVSTRGTRIQMGESVVVRSGGIILLLTTKPTAPMDLAQWRCVGVQPEDLHLIGVKAAIAHRQAYNPITRNSYTVSTPGACSSDILSLPYRKISRPAFPFDPVLCPAAGMAGPL